MDGVYYYPRTATSRPARSGHTPFSYAVFVGVLVVVVLVIVYGRYLATPSSGFGVWGEGVVGPCITTTPNDCDKPGVQTTVQLCLPDPITGRGCLDEGHMQTFAPKVTTSSCRVQCLLSGWTETTSQCMGPGNCPPPGSAGVRRVTRRCERVGSQGVNNCTLLEEVELPGGAGIQHLTRSYSPGDVVVSEELCYDYDRYTCGTWVVDLPGVLGDSVPTPVVGPSRLTPTPTFEGPYILSSSCVTGDDPAYSVLEEGLLTVPMSCLSQSGSLVTPTDLDPPSSECPVLTPDAYDGQWCETTVVTPDQVRTLVVSPDYHPVVCAGIYGGNNPKVVSPCRYLPDLPFDYGRGEDLNLLISSVLLLFTEDGSVLAPLQSPHTGSSVLPLSDYGSSSSDDLRDVQLVALQASNLGDGQCTPESLAYNTGVLLVLGPRSLHGETGCIANVAAVISIRFRGWLGTEVLESRASLIWEQASNGYLSPGHTSATAARFVVELTGPIDRRQPSGYPNTSRGVAPLHIRGEDGSTLWVPTLRAALEGSGEMRNLESASAILFSPETEICTRAIHGSGSCNLLNRRPLLYTVDFCIPPVLVP